MVVVINKLLNKPLVTIELDQYPCSAVSVLHLLSFPLAAYALCLFPFWFIHTKTIAFRGNMLTAINFNDFFINTLALFTFSFLVAHKQDLIK
jgi:hypothetical protein